jgi:hypothetical protein
MYNPSGSCSALVHVLMRVPILVVLLGLLGAADFVRPYLAGKTAEEVIQDGNFTAKVGELAGNQAKREMSEAAPTVFFSGIIKQETGTDAAEIEKCFAQGSMPATEREKDACREIERLIVDNRGEEGRYFTAILKAGGNKWPGVHPDGVSYGPAGLTRDALRDVFRQLPDCYSLGYDEVLNTPGLSIKFAYLYFLDQIHGFGSIDSAVNAYHYGPTKAKKMEKTRKVQSPYLKKVRKHLER